MPTTSTEIADKYVKIPDPKSPGDFEEVKLRFLEWPGNQVFQHWIGPDPQHVRPYNCPSRRAGCPACAERQIAKLKGEDHRAIHRISKKNFANVLEISDDTKLKVYAFGPSVLSAVETLTTRKGKEDPTSYDITVVKRRTGTETFNIEYSAFQEDVRPLTKNEEVLAENKYDLTAETADATNEMIGAAIKGQPVYQYADAETAKKVVASLKKHNMVLTDVDPRIIDDQHIPVSKANEVLEELG
jgi:hypothetical protein